MAGYKRTVGAFGRPRSEPRRPLQPAQGELNTSDVDEKLKAIRRAASYSFPAPDIEQILAETECGYQSEEL